jgi:tetrahydromethanopterin S-methyltransferase subunit A
LSQIDQFESVFRSAVKAVFEYSKIDIRSVLLVTDLDAEAAGTFQKSIQNFLQHPATEVEREFFIITGDEYHSTNDLLELLTQYSPDLICTYRNLHSNAWRFPHSLGEHLDVMLQKTDIPIMVLPHPEANYQAEHALKDTTDVMVVTDLMAVNDRLINYAAAFTNPDGNLYLTHVEDERVFERYMDAISKIDVIDTETARKRLTEQLLKDPEDYFNSCAELLKQNYPQLLVSSLVVFSQLVAEYRHQIESRKLDLLVLSAKDERQHAMHSVAYPLAVELRQIPLLLL